MFGRDLCAGDICMRVCRIHDLVQVLHNGPLVLDLEPILAQAPVQVHDSLLAVLVELQAVAQELLRACASNMSTPLSEAACMRQQHEPGP